MGLLDIFRSEKIKVEDSNTDKVQYVDSRKFFIMAELCCIYWC